MNTPDDALREALEKLGALRSFLNGWQLSDSCKRNNMETECQRWIDGISALYALDSTLAASKPAGWPKDNPWALAVDTAMVNVGLDCTTETSDPEECVDRLVRHCMDIGHDIGPASKPSYWCLTHNRWATHMSSRGCIRCDPALSGVALACEVVSKPEQQSWGAACAASRKNFLAMAARIDDPTWEETDPEIRALAEKAVKQSEPEQLAQAVEPEAPKWWRCATHGRGNASAWGCPECVREMREAIAKKDAALKACVDALAQMKACHDEQTCPAINVADDAIAQAEGAMK